MATLPTTAGNKINFKKLALELSPKINPALLEAITIKESSGKGFLKTGEPKILFEPHIFWRSLEGLKINPRNHLKGNEDILYPNWQKGRYGAESAQHGRLKRASVINKQAALMACSWGAFQILGEAYKQLGYATIQDFVNDANTEDGQVRMFMRFIRWKRLIDELENEDINGFVRLYNGGGQVAAYAADILALYKGLKKKVY